MNKYERQHESSLVARSFKRKEQDSWYKAIINQGIKNKQSLDNKYAF